MHSDMNWRAPARLHRRLGFIAPDAVEIGRGDMAEMVALAMKQPNNRHDQLLLLPDGQDVTLSWPHIRALAERADFPFFI